jgi:tRNA(adenine34) deaminase
LLFERFEHPGMSEHDERFMRLALAEAEAARALGDVPVGAVAVHEGRVIGRGHNRREADANPLRHAELAALDEAARELKAWRLLGVTLYVTLEPCVMCAGALVLSRIDRLVYAAPDPKAGAVTSIFRVLDEPRLNHRVQVTQGVLAAEASELLKTFFRDLRQR